MNLSIDYALPTRRRRWPWIVMIAMVSIGSLAGWRYGPAAYHAGLLRFNIWRAMRDVATPGRVVFDEDPAHWPGLQSKSPNYRVMNNNPGDRSPCFAFVAYWVPSLERLHEQQLYVHAFPWFYGRRRAQAGEWKLVSVGPAGNGVLEGEHGASGDWQVKLSSVRVDVVSRTGVTSSGVAAPLALADRELADPANAVHQPLYLRCYAGMADPKDDSRFSIPYQFGSVVGIILGVLNADGTVSFSAEYGASVVKSKS